MVASRLGSRAAREPAGGRAPAARDAPTPCQDDPQPARTPPGGVPTAPTLYRAADSISPFM